MFLVLEEHPTYVWPPSKDHEYTCSEDGSILHFDSENGPTFIRTKKNVPIEDEMFEFETKIVDGGKHFAIGIGFTTDPNLPLIGKGSPEDMDSNTIGVILGDKAICHCQNYTVVFDEPNVNGDVIGYRLQRHAVAEKGYLLYELFRNGCFVQGTLVQEQNIYPCIWVSSGQVILETNFGSKYFTYNKGIKKIKDLINLYLKYIFYKHTRN